MSLLNENKEEARRKNEEYFSRWGAESTFFDDFFDTQEKRKLFSEDDYETPDEDEPTLEDEIKKQKKRIKKMKKINVKKFKPKKNVFSVNPPYDKVIEKILSEKTKIHNYFQDIIYLTEEELEKIAIDCKKYKRDSTNMPKTFSFWFNYSFYKHKEGSLPFVFFLTKRRKKENRFRRRNGYNYKLIMSKKQF